MIVLTFKILNKYIAPMEQAARDWFLQYRLTDDKTSVIMMTCI